jgi:hypothetical protein
MADGNSKVLGWGTIILLMLATGVGLGLVLGFLGAVLGLPPGVMTASIGASVGIVGAILISRRRAALARGTDGKG